MDTTQASETTVLSEALKEELTENISTIKKILKNNPDFFEELILKCMEVSTKKHVYMSDVKELLYQEYPNLTDYENGSELLFKTYNLVNTLGFNSQITGEFLRENSITTYDGIVNIKQQMIDVVQGVSEVSMEEFTVEMAGDIE